MVPGVVEVVLPVAVGDVTTALSSTQPAMVAKQAAEKAKEAAKQGFDQQQAAGRVHVHGAGPIDPAILGEERDAPVHRRLAQACIGLRLGERVFVDRKSVV